MKYTVKQLLLPALLILFAAGMRILNAEVHLYHLAPVAAIALFSGAVIKDRRAAFLMPLLAQFLADCYFQLFTSTPGFYGVSQVINYAALVSVTLLSMRMGRISVVKVAGFAVCGSLLFFLISNFGVWVNEFFRPEAQRMYTLNLAGLGKTFLMALPFYSPQGGMFFWNSLIGDLLFSGVLFGAYALAVRPRQGVLTAQNR